MAPGVRDEVLLHCLLAVDARTPLGAPCLQVLAATGASLHHGVVAQAQCSLEEASWLWGRASRRGCYSNGSWPGHPGHLNPGGEPVPAERSSSRELDGMLKTRLPFTGVTERLVGAICTRSEDNSVDDPTRGRAVRAAAPMDPKGKAFVEAAGDRWSQSVAASSALLAQRGPSGRRRAPQPMDLRPPWHLKAV